MDDARLIQLWLERYRSPETKRAYLEDVGKLFGCLPGKHLAHMTYTDLQAFLNSLEFYKVNTQHRIFTAVKSLFSFGHRLGQFPFNVAAAIRAPKKEKTLINRILTEEMVLKILALEDNPRNQVLLRLIYAAGLRVSEVCILTWADLIPRPPAGQLTVRGKGDKTRPVLLSQATWEIVHRLLPSPPLPYSPLFLSRKGGFLNSSQVFRIVQQAARRAGIEQPVSPHWLRHAHATHALERGAPLPLVQATLGHESLATTGLYLHARPEDSSARYLIV